MWTPARINNGQMARVLNHLYGFGWELGELRGHPTVGHGGASGTYILRLMDDPLTVIVLTNLDTESGRHPKLLATAIAGAWRQRYAPPHALAPATDPNPSVTKTIEAFLGDISARRKSSAMSGAYRAWYNSALGSRVWMSTQLAGTAPLRYLAHDDLAGRSLWQREPLDRLVHYATDVKGRPTYLSVGLTRDGSIGALDFYGR